MKLDDLKIMPYIEIDGIRLLRNSEVLSCFERMAQDGTAESVFYDQGIQTPQEFLSFVKTDVDLFLYFEYLGQPAGIAWFQQIASGVAQGHFCLFSSMWGQPEIVEIGKQVVQYAFKVYHLIIGFIPRWNVRAIHYMEELGADRVAVLPSFAKSGELAPDEVVMISFTRGYNENLH